MFCGTFSTKKGGGLNKCYSCNFCMCVCLSVMNICNIFVVFQYVLYVCLVIGVKLHREKKEGKVDMRPHVCETNSFL